MQAKLVQLHIRGDDGVSHETITLNPFQDSGPQHIMLRVDFPQQSWVSKMPVPHAEVEKNDP